MKAIMYHYIRDQNAELPFFRYLSANNFSKQLDYFEKEFGFVEKTEWESYLASGVLPKKKGKVLLTFDDATFCHEEFVLPELVRRNLWAIFFVPTQPVESGKLLKVHKTHLLCGKFSAKLLLKSGLSILEANKESYRELPEADTKTYTRQDNHPGVTEFKRLINYALPHSIGDRLVDEIATMLDFDFYDHNVSLNLNQLKKLQQSGMYLGSHTCSHPVMSTLTVSAQEKEILLAEDFLEKNGLMDVKSYCHPYGGFHSFDKHTINILSEAKYVFAFNVEQREITGRDWSNSLLALPRYDCNQFAFGKAS